jgi:hypothetical protein
MLDMSDVVDSVDLQAPQPFTIQRSPGLWVGGVFQPTGTVQIIPVFGPVQRASDKEAEMLPAADVIHGIMAFWATQPIYTTRGKAPEPGTHGEVPQGAMPGAIFTLTVAPPGEDVAVYRNGIFQSPLSDYEISGNLITFNVIVNPGDKLFATWPVRADVGSDFADVLVYKSEQYRVLNVRHYPGSGYHKALASRLSAI